MRSGEIITVNKVNEDLKKIRKLLNEVTDFNVRSLTTLQFRSNPSLFPRFTTGLLNSTSKQEEGYTDDLAGVKRWKRDIEYLKNLR